MARSRSENRVMNVGETSDERGKRKLDGVQEDSSAKRYKSNRSSKKMSETKARTFAIPEKTLISW